MDLLPLKKASPDSDIDVFVVGNNLKEEVIITDFNHLERTMPREINYITIIDAEY
jgi:hypothetical protein